ncbi:protein of unknown function [Aminobacter niigataensis]|nr:protein of unknown function [Aminobacter niigataensis]
MIAHAALIGATQLLAFSSFRRTMPRTSGLHRLPPVISAVFSQNPQFSFGTECGSTAILSIINKSDLIIDSRSRLVFRQGRILDWEECTSIRGDAR